ncbi:hypothetical protein SAV31267_087070 [Streptomyces avermitilis]|uniref:NAD(+) kinase n=1 Tax=Streptomyces avermitilis TaxID=33903 RepID=A0A4D4N3Z0_STRAX|nr:hypothetical protein SAV31267_087070 [Streptomyces avermitilis]
MRTDCAEGDDWGIALHVTALNDIVLEKLARDRQVSVGVYLAGRLLASYSADALLVATPTGSTAYSFAAGGPVVSPRAEALIFTPVAPHMAFNRSVVAAPDEPIALRVLDRSGPAAVSVDGQLRGVLDPGDWIGVYAAPRRLKAVRLGPMDFYGRLRERMNLTDAPAAVADGQAAPLWPVTSAPPADLAHLTLPQGPVTRRPPRERGARRCRAGSATGSGTRAASSDWCLSGVFPEVTRAGCACGGPLGHPNGRYTPGRSGEAGMRAIPRAPARHRTSVRLPCAGEQPHPVVA